jgi:excisionase family DNA binding protein
MYTTAEAAKALGLSQRHVAKLIADQIIPGVKRSNTWFITEEALEKARYYKYRPLAHVRQPLQADKENGLLQPDGIIVVKLHAHSHADSEAIHAMLEDEAYYLALANQIKKTVHEFLASADGVNCESCAVVVSGATNQP